MLHHDDFGVVPYHVFLIDLLVASPVFHLFVVAPPFVYVLILHSFVSPLQSLPRHAHFLIFFPLKFPLNPEEKA